MTVKELRDLLGCFDDDDEIVIGEYQHRGTDFAYDPDAVFDTRYHNWDEEGSCCDENGKPCVVICIGNQIGSMIRDDDDEYCD